MKMLPAIDLIQGHAVRLIQGDYGKQTTYGDPVRIAHAYAQSGASMVHIVDLDAAKSGQSHEATRQIIKTIIDETGLAVEIGGGIRKASDIEAWLSQGVWRCVLGTSAVTVEGFAKDMVTQFGRRVIVGIDAKDGLVAIHGWTAVADLSAAEFARQMAQYGYDECIYTDIAQDGMLRGANIDFAVQLARASGLGVIVSGGVRDIDDVQRAVAAKKDGITGLIAGKSLVEGTLDLKLAMAIINKEGGAAV